MTVAYKVKRFIKNNPWAEPHEMLVHTTLQTYQDYVDECKKGKDRELRNKIAANFKAQYAALLRLDPNSVTRAGGGGSKSFKKQKYGVSLNNPLGNE